MRVFWLLMEPNAEIPFHDHPYSAFAVIRAGTGLFLDESGSPSQVIRGESAQTGMAAVSDPPTRTHHWC